MTDLDDYHRLVAYWRAHGLSESDAHAKAEEIMEDADHHPESVMEDTMKHFTFGLIVGSVLTASLGMAGQLYNSNGSPAAPSGSIQQYDSFRQRQQFLDLNAMRRNQEEALRQQRLTPCAR